MQHWIGPVLQRAVVAPPVGVGVPVEVVVQEDAALEVGATVIVSVEAEIQGVSVVDASEEVSEAEEDDQVSEVAGALGLEEVSEPQVVVTVAESEVIGQDCEGDVEVAGALQLVWWPSPSPREILMTTPGADGGVGSSQG